jgi:hypothetical protein
MGLNAGLITSDNQCGFPLTRRIDRIGEKESSVFLPRTPGARITQQLNRDWRRHVC